MERVRAQLQGRPATERTRRRAAAPRDTALLYGVLLRGAARLDAGMELTDLEAGLLAPLGHLLSEEDIREIGRVYTEEASVRHAPQLFPQTVTARPLAEGYATEDLLKDLPETQDISAQPNVNVVDVGATEVPEELNSIEFCRAVEEAGFGVTLVTSSAPAEQAAANFHARIVLDKMHCVDATNGETGRDEIYWALSSGSDGGGKHTRKTEHYGSLNSGDWATIRAEDQILFDGIISKIVACNIACWEEDDSTSGFHDEMRRKLRIISDELAKFSELIAPLPSGQWGNTADWIMLASMIVRLIEELIAWLRNDDDFIQEHTIVFDRPAIAALAALPNQTRYFQFTGDGGIFRLYARWAGRGDTRLLSTTSTNGTAWSTDTPFPSGGTVAAAALAVYDGKLFSMVRSAADDGRLYWNRYDGPSWSAFSYLAGASPSAPALAAHGSKLYSAHHSVTGELFLDSFDGHRWAGYAKLPDDVRTFSAPALASYNGKLHLMIRRAKRFHPSFNIYLDSDDLHWATFDGTRWSAFTALPAKSTSTPALAPFNNMLFAVHRSIADDGLYWTTLHTNNVWYTYQKFPSGKTGTAPALAAHNGKLYCAVRAAGAGQDLWEATAEGPSWSGFRRIPATSLSAPALASHNGTLHCVHRG
ncbi:hypothetical protein [Streptomyces sp. bgisy100]|uniref:hypothetical protein n=1 Tax=Streptomyces sp. bgisy100 TaxID=3413783 RepID=UPI003D7542ED